MSQCEALSIIICSHQPKPCPPQLYELPNKLRSLTTRTVLYYSIPLFLYWHAASVSAFNFLRKTLWKWKLLQHVLSSFELVVKQVHRGHGSKYPRMEGCVFDFRIGSDTTDFSLIIKKSSLEGGHKFTCLTTLQYFMFKSEKSRWLGQCFPNCGPGTSNGPYGVSWRSPGGTLKPSCYITPPNTSTITEKWPVFGKFSLLLLLYSRIQT